jgi:hypothetical protein
MQDFKLTNANGENVFAGPLDIDYDANGQMVMIEGVYMLDQVLKKDSMTKYGASALFPQYGLAIGAVRGGKIFPTLLGSLLVGEMKRMVGLVQSAINSVSTALPEEKITGVSDVLIQMPSGDPRSIQITTSVKTLSGQAAPLITKVQAF